MDDVKLFQDAVARKKMTRWIMILVGLFIVTGGILLIVTLNMSEDIDSKGKRVHTNINIEFSAHDAFLE